MVPKQLRDRIWATWRSGQAAFSCEHQDAVRQAMAVCEDARIAMQSHAYDRSLLPR